MNKFAFIIGLIRILALIILLVIFTFIFALNNLFSGPKKTRLRAAFLLKVLSTLFLKIMGFKIKDSRKHSPDKVSERVLKNTLFLCNHLSYTDILLIVSKINTSFLAKKEVAAYPLIGLIARFSGVVFVQRESLQARLKALKRIKSELASKNICVFPEGTTTAETFPDASKWNAKSLLSLVAKENDVQILGVYYGKDAQKYAWVGDDNLLSHIWRMVTSFHKCATLLGAPLLAIPTESEINAKELSNTAFAHCNELLKDHITDSLVSAATAAARIRQF